MTLEQLKNLSGPFGTPDGSRASIDTVMHDFVDLESIASFGALATRADDATVRVIVGKMGAGKTVYMRRLFSHQDSSNAVYADAPQQTLPQTDLIVQVCNWYPRAFLTEKWMHLWGRAILRSLATHLMASPEMAQHVSPETAEELQRYYGDLIGEFRRPRSIYSAMREIISSHNSGNHLSRYLENPAWDDLEDALAEVLRNSRPVFFYLDAVDDTFNAAPFYWLRCHEGLFLQVMQLLRDSKFGSRLHVVICVRDLVLSSIFQSEHAPRYHGEPHIRLLDWTSEAIEYLLLSKLERLAPRYKMAPDVPNPVQAWLGASWVHNERRGIDENLLEYLIRHTRLIPRDIVSLGNELSRVVLEQKAAGRSEIPPEALRMAVAESSKRFGDSQLAQCASQIAADTMPRHAAALGFSDGYISSQEYAASVRDQMKLIISSIGVDRFKASALKAMDDLSRDQFQDSTRVSSVLWQNGLLGYTDRDEFKFFTSPETGEFDIPDDAEEYVFHPCLLDSVRGVRSVGPRPVYPYSRR